VIETAQASGIQKRLASENKDKEHQNVHGVALAANGALKQNSLLYQEKRSRERVKRDAAGKRAGSSMRSNMRRALPQRQIDGIKHNKSS